MQKLMPENERGDHIGRCDMPRKRQGVNIGVSGFPHRVRIAFQEKRLIRSDAVRSEPAHEKAEIPGCSAQSDALPVTDQDVPALVRKKVVPVKIPMNQNFLL